MSSLAIAWQIYRTRFLIRARQLQTPLAFTDSLGREHRGQKGDYLVESADGLQRIAPREIFEDIYVPMGGVADGWPNHSDQFASHTPPNPNLVTSPAVRTRAGSPLPDSAFPPPDRRSNRDRRAAPPHRNRVRPSLESAFDANLAHRWTGKSA